MKLYGRIWTRREIEKYVGHIEQIGGLHHYRLSDGKADGVEQIRVRIGSELTYLVNVSLRKE